MPAAIVTVGALALWWSSRRSSKYTSDGDLHLIPKAQDTVPVLGRIAVVRVRERIPHLLFDLLISHSQGRPPTASFKTCVRTLEVSHLCATTRARHS